MNSASLRLFKAVAETGSIVGAAKRLHCVSSNVTTRLKQLEANLNVSLFIREKNRLYITPEGEHLLHYTNRILALMDEAKAALSEKKPVGPLHLGSMETTAAIRLPPLLSAFSQQEPMVELNLRTMPTEQLIEQVLSSDLGIAFVADNVKLAHEKLSSAVLFHETLLLVTAKDHPSVRTAADLRVCKPLAFRNGCNYRYRFERWLNTQGVIAPGIQEFGSFQAILGCVASGMGIALLPENVVREYEHRLAIRCHPIDPEIADVDTRMVWLKSSEVSRVVTRFRDFAIHYAAMQNDDAPA
ncbi:LysR family transcriptional regulator [Brenneria tiliae]|uniref:LysR family transcriptional regulator n=1 Tax=Brenneria tiliae TaxID=2914984 RepID=UPI002014F920|nr:LysR family transcriptional regulator [Brenneria tiliae]MCL2898713.1 LysR family transcriptional regulator [Brenneria tiliae]MCL2903350.1 LysR family transcriptional regulator [Brenneria tiliae]